MQRRRFLALLGIAPALFVTVFKKKAVAALQKEGSTAGLYQFVGDPYSQQRAINRKMICDSYEQQAGRLDRPGVTRQIKYIKIRDADTSTEQMLRLKKALRVQVSQRRKPCR